MSPSCPPGRIEGKWIDLLRIVEQSARHSPSRIALPKVGSTGKPACRCEIKLVHGEICVRGAERHAPLLE